MAKLEFARLVFQGARFNEARMPLDALAELAAYRLLVVSTARALFQIENPKRQRVPKRFEAGLQLFLDEVQEGSVMPVISRIVERQGLFGDYFDQARDVVEETVRAASLDSVLSTALPNAGLTRFSVFGKTLQDGERIVLMTPGGDGGATYDREVRRTILRLSNMSYEDDIDLLGEVIEADKGTHAFEFKTKDGMRIPVNESVLFDDAKRFFFYETGVRLRGRAILDADGKPQRIIETIDLGPEGEDDVVPRLGCPTPVSEQVQLLAELRDGWMDDDVSTHYDPDHLRWLALLLNAIVGAFSLPTPYIYPALDGQVRAEWSSSGVEVVAKIDVQEHTAEIITVRGPNSITEETVKFADVGAESKFGRFVVDSLRTNAA